MAGMVSDVQLNVIYRIKVECQLSEVDYGEPNEEVICMTTLDDCKILKYRLPSKVISLTNKPKLMPDFKTVRFPIPSLINEDHKFVEINEVNDLLNQGYKLQMIDNSNLYANLLKLNITL